MSPFFDENNNGESRDRLLNSTVKTVSIPVILSEIEDKIRSLNLIIVNDPSKGNLNKENILSIDQIHSQEKKLFSRYATAQGYYLRPVDESRSLSEVEARDIFKTMHRLHLGYKTLTCDGLSIIAFHLIREFLETKNITNYRVDLCTLRNWTHSFLRIIPDPLKGSSPVIGDDYSTKALITASFFSEHVLSVLDKAGDFIQKNSHLYNMASGTMMENQDADFSYYLLCSNREFMREEKCYKIKPGETSVNVFYFDPWFRGINGAYSEPRSNSRKLTEADSNQTSCPSSCTLS